MLPLDEEAVLWSTPQRERAGRPLLVLLHGLGSHEGDLFALAPYLPLELVVAAVRAPLAHPPGFAWFRPGSVEGEAAVAAAWDEAADGLLAWLAAQTGFSSVGLLGFSQGGAVAVHALRRDPGCADYAVNLAGFVVPAPEEEPGDAALAERRPPVFWGRGTRDDVIPEEAVRRTMAWLPHHSSLTAYSYELLGHAVSEEELTDVGGFLRAHAG